jgi:phosphoglycerate dehydrogenase-like enzyme
MKLLIQNWQHENPAFQATDAMWRAAAARHPDVAAKLDVILGQTRADFDHHVPDADFLITWTSVVKEFFPAPQAKRLKIVFMTSAGLDRIAPFDWLPPGAILSNNSGVQRA